MRRRRAICAQWAKLSVGKGLVANMKKQIIPGSSPPDTESRPALHAACVGVSDRPSWRMTRFTRGGTLAGSLHPSMQTPRLKKVKGHTGSREARRIAVGMTGVACG